MLTHIAGAIIGETHPRYVVAYSQESFDILHAIMVGTNQEFRINAYLPERGERVNTELELLKILLATKASNIPRTEQDKHLRRKIEEKLRKEVPLSAQRILAQLLNVK